MSIISEQITQFRNSALGRHVERYPWEIVLESADIVREMLGQLSDQFAIRGDVAVHHSAVIERGSVIKGPAVVGPNCLVAATAYIRGGCWLEANCIVGPGAELKSSLVFNGTKLAHFNFVGDSILGAGVNLEAGSIVANYRNEWSKPTISFVYRDAVLNTGVEKFGALVGDRAKIGANAVIAPGAIIGRDTIVGRLAIVDQAALSN